MSSDPTGEKSKHWPDSVVSKLQCRLPGFHSGKCFDGVLKVLIVMFDFVLKPSDFALESGRVEDLQTILSSFIASIEARQTVVETALTFTSVGTNALTMDEADNMIENVIGVHSLPLGVCTNLVVNGIPRLVPMCTEEASVVGKICVIW